MKMKTRNRTALLVTLLISCTILSCKKEEIDSLKVGLIAYYPFNGNAIDESGNNLNGTVTNAIPESDRFGNPNSAFGFDGNNGTERYISSNIGANDTITFCVWFKSPSPETYYPSIINYGTTRSTHIQVLGDQPTYIREGRVGKIWVGSVLVEGSTWSTYIESDKNYADNNWHFLVTTFVPHDNLYLYIDNELVGSYEYGESYPSDGVLYIGREINDNAAGDIHETHFKGIIDDIRIYNRSLTNEELLRLFSESE